MKICARSPKHVARCITWNGWKWTKTHICEEISTMFQFLQSKRVDWSVAENSRQRRDFALILQLGFAQYCLHVVCTGSRFHSCTRFHERILSIRNLTNRFEGIPQAVVDEDPARRALMSRLTRQMVESPNNQELMRRNTQRESLHHRVRGRKKVFRQVQARCA